MVHYKGQRSKIKKLKKGDWIAVYLNEASVNAQNKPIEIGQVLAWVINGKLQQLYKSLDRNPILPAWNVEPAIAIETADRKKKWFGMGEAKFKKLKVNKRFSFEEAKALEKLLPLKM